MRLWSLNPTYLDSKGLVALWREGLLARKVLHGQTRGYRHHPQLARFKGHPQPERAIDAYLWAVHEESVARGYRFDATKLAPCVTVEPIPVTEGQLAYELQHLLNKLSVRDPQRHQQVAAIRQATLHPLFVLVPGPTEPWEIV